MRTCAALFLATAIASLAACGDSGSTTTAPSSGSASERAAQDLRAAGDNIKAAATEAATEVRPALRRAGEETREAVHDLSEKIADRTATAPAPAATRP